MKTGSSRSAGPTALGVSSSAHATEAGPSAAHASSIGANNKIHITVRGLGPAGTRNTGQQERRFTL